MLSFRIFCSWSYVTFGPVKVRKRGRERWWYAECPNISHRRNGIKSQIFLLELILLPYWFRNQLKSGIMVREAVVSHWSAGMTVQQGISHLFMEASWVHPCVQIADIPLIHEIQSGDWVVLTVSRCALLRPCGICIFSLSFRMFLNKFPPLLFPAHLNGLFGVASSISNHPSFYCSNIVLAEVTSVEQKWACWHFVKPCLRPLICFFFFF